MEERKINLHYLVILVLVVLFAVVLRLANESLNLSGSIMSVLAGFIVIPIIYFAIVSFLGRYHKWSTLLLLFAGFLSSQLFFYIENFEVSFLFRIFGSALAVALIGLVYLPDRK